MIRAAAFALMAAHAGPSAAESCRQALAIGLDVSASVDAGEYALQIGGLASALRAPAVRAAILAAPADPVWLAVYDWSGVGDQRLILPWAPIRSEADLAAVADRIAATTRVMQSPSTGVGAAMRFGAELLAGRAGCRTLTLNLTGDGENNSGPAPDAVALARTEVPVTVNVLVIGAGRGTGEDGGQPSLLELSGWFARKVIRGPGAFIEPTLGYKDFARAMERKLLRELAVPVIGLRMRPGPGQGRWRISGLPGAMTRPIDEPVSRSPRCALTVCPPVCPPGQTFARAISRECRGGHDGWNRRGLQRLLHRPGGAARL